MGNFSSDFIAISLQKNKKGVLESERSFLSVDKDNVICSTLKKAESNGDGYVLRFFELEGKKSKVKMKLDLNQKISKAFAVSLIENDLEELTVNDNNEVAFEINGHGIKTIRVLSNPSEIVAVNDLKAIPVSNGEITVKWVSDNSTNLSHYNVYRSLNADFIPNRLSFIGTSEGTSYFDQTELNYGGWGHKRLDPNTTYFYRVAPVDMFNNEGSLSKESVKCTTLSSSVADAKPLKVEGLYQCMYHHLLLRIILTFGFIPILKKMLTSI